MDIHEKYEYWLTFDDNTKNELESITDKKEIEDRFYKDLEFGTGGLRGIMGAGANRMNKYTVGKATKGLCEYLKNEFAGEKSVVIAYDSRNNSKAFAECAAEILCYNGIKTFLFEEIIPTPVLSFSVRYLNCNAGIVITASHNPKEYNGYKVYDKYGCQLVPQYADKVISYINNVKDIKSVKHMNLNMALSNGYLTYIGDEVLNSYISEVEKMAVYKEASDLKIVYTPLHGTGNIPVRKVLSDMSFDVSVVKEQAVADGNFTTVRSPNPEEKDALNMALEQAKRANADLVIGTDPDCDRVGVGVLHNGEYTLLTGNQTGALLVDFYLKFKKQNLNPKSTLVKTIVTNDLGAEIARKNGLNVVETLTGFKYIGDQITMDLAAKSYAKAFETYANLCDEFITQAKSGNPYDVSDLRAMQPLAKKWIFISIGIGLFIGICVVSGMSAKMKTVHSQSTAKDYMKKGSLDITGRSDLYLYHTITKRKIEKSSSGSSTHHSSSGGRHGGGGGKF